MSNETTNIEATKGGVSSKSGLYAYASKYSKEAIDCLYLIMTTSNNEGIRLGAAKALLNKTLPDLKSFEEDDKPITGPIIYVPKKMTEEEATSELR